MMKLVFATNNLHKLEEIGALLGGDFQLLGLKDIQLEENASQKAWYIHDRSGLNCFADDTGLEVDALDGAPGVYSARYSRIGDPVFPDMEASAGNIRKLLLQMEGTEKRTARFRTVISLVLYGKEYQFEGVVEGHITGTPAGSRGFGYDPVFIPSGYDTTFAEMDLSLKNRISHRARAIRKLVDFLKSR